MTGPALPATPGLAAVFPALGQQDMPKVTGAEQREDSKYQVQSPPPDSLQGTCPSVPPPFPGDTSPFCSCEGRGRTDTPLFHEGFCPAAIKRSHTIHRYKSTSGLINSLGGTQHTQLFPPSSIRNGRGFKSPQGTQKAAAANPCSCAAGKGSK